MGGWDIESRGSRVRGCNKKTKEGKICLTTIYPLQFIHTCITCWDGARMTPNISVYAWMQWAGMACVQTSRYHGLVLNGYFS